MAQNEENEKLIIQVSSSDEGVDSPTFPQKEAWYKRLYDITRHKLFQIWGSGMACMISAALVFSLSAFFVKLIHGKVPVFEIVVFRSSVSFLFCVFLALIHNVKNFFGHSECFWYLLARGIFGAAAMTFYYMTIQLLPLADAVTLFFLNPAVTAVAAWLILKEPLGIKGAVGVLMSFTGLILITRPPFLFPSSSSSSGGSTTTTTTTTTSTTSSNGWSNDQFLGSLFGVIAAFCAASAFIAIRRIGKREPPIVMSVYFHIMAFMTSIIPLSIGVPKRIMMPEGVQWLLLVLIALTSLAGQMLLGRGFQLLSAAKASAINFTQVIYSYIFGIFFLHEHISLLGVFGSGLIACGVLLVNLKPKKKEPAPVAVVASSSSTDVNSSSAGTAAANNNKQSGQSEAKEEEADEQRSKKMVATNQDVAAAAEAEEGRAPPRKKEDQGLDDGGSSSSGGKLSSLQLSGTGRIGEDKEARKSLRNSNEDDGDFFIAAKKKPVLKEEPSEEKERSEEEEQGGGIQQKRSLDEGLGGGASSKETVSVGGSEGQRNQLAAETEMVTVAVKKDSSRS